MMMSYFVNTYNYLKYNWKYIFRDFKNGINNLIQWFPIIWCDANWDNYYIFKVLQFKIKNTSKYINKHRRYEGYERDVEIINTCVNLIDKIISIYYEVEYQDYYKTKFLFKPILGTTKSLLEDTIVENNLQKYFGKYPNDCRRAKGDIKSKEVSLALTISMQRHERAIKLLFILIERNIQKWWD
jgi:hypothetical protein